MSEFWNGLFSSDFMGHGYCYLWKPEIVWLHAISDGLIAVSYYFIPVALAYLVRKRRDLPFNWVFFMFGLFIFSCGTTHAMEIWTLWHGTYRLAGLIKAITAGASLATAIALVPTVPRALRLPSHAQLHAANLELEMEITERKRVEAALRESEERFRRVFEDGPLGLGLVGKDYHFVKVNWALCQMVGYSEAELLQKSFVDITHPADVHEDVELAERLFRREIPFYKLRKRYVKKNGEIIWIDLTGSVIRDKEGEVMYGLAMIEDITEVKRTQEMALARQKLESLGVLASGIAHDFNNLLGGILASTELALTERADGLAVDEELQRIKTASIRGAEIVQELMIYGGEESPAFEPVDISALVNEMLELLKVSISKHTILSIELSQDLPPIHANPAQIRRVVMNLVTNASEAIGDRPGTIRVTTAKVKVGWDSPEPGGVDLARGDYLRLEVFDTGHGMTPEVQTRIFDPFFTTKRAGRGLGLAAVQGVIHGHGGWLRVESASGHGSRFQILLPCIGQAVRESRRIIAIPSTGEAVNVTGNGES